MNKIFKVIWNQATQQTVVVSELAQNTGKVSSSTSTVAEQQPSLLKLSYVFGGVSLALLGSPNVDAAYTNGTSGNVGTHRESIAIGAGPADLIANAASAQATAVGSKATASAEAVAFGTNSTAGTFASSIGVHSAARGTQAVAMGYKTIASGSQSTALGSDSLASGASSVAIGGDDLDITANDTAVNTAFTEVTGNALVAKVYQATTASGGGAVAVGVQSTATGDLSTAFGTKAVASGMVSTALGSAATASGLGSFAGSAGSVASGKTSIAIGAKANANSETSIAIGRDANAQTLTPGTRGTDPAWSPKNGGGLVNGALGSSVTIGQIAIGQGATTLAGSTVTVDGRASISSGQHAIAIGSHARTTESMDIAIGAGANVERKFTSGPRALHSGYTGVKNGTTYLSSMALGFNANSGGSHGDVIIGAEASSAVNSERAIAQATAIGSRAKVYGDQALAIGADTLALGHSSISIGGDDITLAKASLDAMATGLNMAAFTIESLRGSASTNHQALFNQPNGAGVERYPNTASIGNASVAVGPASQSLGVASVAMGVNSLTYGTSSVALGTFARSGNKDDPNSVQNTIAIGTQATASNKSAIAIGLGSNASGSQSIAVGVGNQVSGDNSGAFGDPNIVSGNNSYAFGNNNTVNSANAFVLGNNVTTTTANSVFLGTGSNFTAAATTDVFTSTTEATGTTAGLNEVSGAKVNGIEYGGFAGRTAEGVVSVGTANNERRIQGVAAGLISAGSTDAINGSQLYAVADKLNKKNYFHTNPSDNEALQGGANNLDVVDGVGSATGGKAIAAGVDAAASGKSAVAMGRGATADSLANIAIGEAAQAVTADKNTGAQDGKKDESDGVNKAIAIGASAKALNAKTIAVGDAANASGKNSSAIGSQANVSGEEATGIGTAVTASGNYSTAIGQRATATNRLATAIGSLSKATGEEAVAIGRDALSEGSKTVAIGSNSVASGSQTIAMGSGANSSAVHSVAISTEANATANQAIAIGKSAKSFGASSIAIGDGAKVEAATATNSVAIGQGANATAASATAVGRGAAATGTNAFAGGREAKASQVGSVAMGYNATSSQVNAISIGTDSSATQANAVALGRSAAATLSGSVALGVNATTSASVAVPSATVNGITYSGFAANTTVEPGYVVSVGKAGAERQIQNVAAGQITATSTDAINGSQLYMTNQVLGNLANATVSNFGGNAILNKSGDKAGDITFTNIGNTGKDTIHDAIAAVKENVVAGTNIVSVTSQADTTTGATTYTVNAKGTTASSANQNYVTVTPGQPNGENITDYAVDLSDAAKASLAKADTAVQNIASPDGSVIVSKAPNDPNTTNLQVNRGTGISLDANGRLTVTKTTLDQSPTTMEFAAKRGQTNNFVNAGDLADHLNKAGFKLAVGQTSGGVSSDTASSEEAKRIRTGETLTMTAGKGMNIKQVDHGYEFSVDSAEVGVAGNKATVPTDSDNKMATVGSVAKAINESGFTLKTSANGGEKLTSSNEEVINPADAVEMIAGKNLTVQQGENGKITYATKDDVTFNSVTANNTTTNNLKVNPNGNVDMGGNQITNVASGGNVDDNAANIGDVKTAVETAKEKVIAGTNIVNVVEGKEGERTTFTVNAKGTTASSANEDYVTVKADPTDGNNVTNYKVDLGQKAKDSLAKADTAVQNFKVTVNGADVQTVANGDTVKFVNGTGTTARNTSGQITFDINKSTLTTDPAGNVTNNNKGDTFVTGDDVAKAINEATARTEKTTTVVKGSNTHVKAKEVGNNTEYTVSADKATVSVSGALTKTETPTTDATTGAVTTDYALDLSQTTKDDIKKGVDAKDTVDNKGLTFTGDSGSTNVEKLGSTVAVNGDTNIATSAKGDQITIKLKDDITVNSVTANATTTTNLTVKPNGNVNMGGNKITNVAKGEADTDAVNVSQLNEKLGNSAWNLKVAQDNAAATNVGDGKINGDNTVTFTGKGAVKVSTKTAATETANYGVDIEVETAQISANTTTGKVGTGDNGAETAPNTSALATAGDVINAVNNSFWKVGLGEGATATKKDDVKAGDTVNFANGTGTTVSVETVDNTTTVKYSIDKGTITSNANTGDVSTPDTTNDKVATTKDVVDAIKGSGFKLTASKADGGDEEETETKEEVINPGEKVEVVAGKNLKVKQEASGKITLATKDDVTFNNVTTTNLTSDTIKVPTGTTTADKPITISKDGIDMAGKPITNVTNGLTPYAPGTPKDGLVDLTKPSTVTDNTVATVGDLRNMGWVVSSDKTTGANEGQPNGDAFNKQVRNAGEVKFVGTGAAKVSGAEKDGANVITVHVDPAEAPKTAPIAANSTTGLVGSKNGDVVGGVPNDNTALATAADVVNAVNNTFWKVFANDATDANKKDDVKAGDNLVFAKGDGTTVSVETEGDNTTTVKYSIDKGTIKSDASTGDVSTTDGDNKVATTKDVVDAIKNSGFKLTASKADGGDEEVTTTTEEVINPSDTVEIIAGKNLKVKQEANGKITLSTLDNVSFNNVVVSGNVTAGDTVFNKDGITINNGNTNNKPVTLTKDGLNNGDNKVTGVAKGDVNATSTDAINGSQLHDLIEKGFKVTADNGTADTVKLGETVAYRSASGNIVTTVSDNNINFELANKVTVGDKTNGKPVTIDGTTGTVNGLTNKTWTPDTITSGQAATEDQLKAVSDVANAGWNLTANGQNSSNVAPNDTVDLNNTDGNINISKKEDEDKVTFNLNNTVKLGDTTKNPTGSQLTIDGDKGVISGLNTTLQAIPNTPNPATPVAAPTLTDAQKTQAATLGDVLNAGWNVKGNGEQKDFVQAYDSVDFVNGIGTTAVVTSTDGKATTVKFDINSTTLTQNTDGKAKAGDTNNFATAGNVAEAINKVGLKFSGDVASGTTNTFKRENQDEAKIVGGITDTSKLTDNNIGVVSNGVDTLTVKLAKDINVNSVKATENITIGDGAGSTKLTSTTDGLKVEKADGAAQKITNVEAGTADTDAVNVSQLNDKLAASKWKLQTSQDKGTATDVGEINADDVVVIDGTGAIKVTNTQEAGKTSKVHIAVETAKISTNPDTGKAGTGDNGSTNAPTDTALATAGDVINAVNSVFWKVGQGEGTTAQEKDKVQAGDTVNFANGTGTTVSVETVDNTTTVKYSIDKGTITTDPQTGDVSTPDATNDKVATTKDVVDAIKGSGFKLTASKADGGDEEETETKEEVINPGEKVEVVAGKNLKVKQEANGKITLSTLDNVNFNNVVVSGNVSAGDTVFNKDGITINNGNTNNKPVTLGKDGLNNGDNKVTGVAKGDVNATSTDAINGSQLHDLIEKGFKVTADNGDADTVKLGETVAYRSASGNIVTTVSDNKINFELANKVTVGDQTNGKPVTIDGTTGTVNGLTNKTWNPNAITSGQAATEDQLKAVSDVANAGWNLTANGQNSSNVASGETVDLNNTDKNIVITKNANEDKVTFNLAKDLTVDSVKAGDTTINNDGLKVGENTVTKAPITVNGNTVSNINDAINQTAEQAFSPLTFAGDSGNNVERKLGEQVNVKGGVTEATKLSDGNIGVVANGKDTLEVKLAKDIKGIDSISVTNGPTINGDGINMNGDKISNLADGVDDKDAVNVSQLKKAQAAATTKVEGDQGVTVTSKENADGSKTYTVAAKTDGQTVKVDENGNIAAVTTTLVDANNDGKVDAPQGDDAKKLVNAGDIANAINNSGWKLAADGTDGTELINPSDTVTFKVGSENLTVKREGADITYDLAKDINVDSVTSNTITVPTDETNPANNPITINKDGINAGNKAISNVASNLAPVTAGDKVQASANNPADLANKLNNAATVSDVLNAGWNLQGNGTAVDTVTHNDTVDFVNGKGTVVTVEKKDGKNIIKVDSPIEFVNTNTNDTSTPSNTAKLTGANPVQLTNVASGLRQDDGTAPTGKDLADAIKNASGSTLNNAVNVGDLKAATDAAKTEVKGTGLATVAAPTIGDNGQAIYTVDVAKADAPTVTRGSVTVKAGDENKVMVAGDVAKAITDSEKTSSVKAGSSAVTVTEGAEDANGNTEYTVDVATDKTIARDKDGKLTVNTGSSLKVDGTTGKIDVNTDGTTITTDPATGAVKANTTALTNDDKGKVNTPAVPNALATAGDIANAINNSGFTLKTSANGGSKVSGADEVINPGETIDMAAGKNLTVTQDANGKVTYATAEEVSFTTVNSTTVVVGNPADPNNSTTLTSGNGGLNVGGDKITGVAEGDITPTSKDAVNGSQIFALTGGAKTTIGDVTVTNPDGSTTTYKNVVLDENGNPALVTYNVKTQGEHITNSVITAINNMNTQGIKFFHTNDGKADSTRPSDQRYNTEDSSASGRYASAVGYQAEASGESSVAMGNNATASGANAIAIGVNSQATGKNTISIGNGNIVTGENSGAFGDPSKIDATNSYSVGNNNEIAVGQTDVFALGNNVKATVSNSVFLGSESGVFDQANASRNTTTGVHIATASSNYTYRGENDANVAGVADAVGVVSVGNATSTRQVQGVAAGVVSATSTDAINGSQLFYTNKAIGDLQGDVYKLGNTVNKMNRNLRAGIAGANAAAGLPQVYIPGKSMVAASAGTYKGEGALAVGYSRASDNGKLILKLQGNTNTRGEVGASVGVGYQW